MARNSHHTHTGLAAAVAGAYILSGVALIFGIAVLVAWGSDFWRDQMRVCVVVRDESNSTLLAQGWVHAQQHSGVAYNVSWDLTHADALVAATIGNNTVTIQRMADDSLEADPDEAVILGDALRGWSLQDRTWAVEFLGDAFPHSFLTLNATSIDGANRGELVLCPE